MLNVTEVESNLNKIVTDHLVEIAKGLITKERSAIDNAFRGFVEKNFKNNYDYSSKLEKALNWAVENALDIGVRKALEELNFSEMIFQEAKKILNDPEFLREIAIKKVRASLGVD
jgi:hypothetical protein